MAADSASPGPPGRPPLDVHAAVRPASASGIATRIASAVSLRMIVIVFCAALVASMWTILLLDVAHERDLVVRSKTMETANLARVVEEHVVQTLRAAEIALRGVRAEYAAQGRRFDLRKFASERSHRADPYNAFGIQDANGDLVLQSTPYKGPQNFRNTEDYQFHARTDTRELFISKPRRGTTTGKWSIYLSQRINRRDGSFGGLALLAIDQDYFSRFYDQIDLGRDDVVNLVGRDGVIRARQSHDQTTSGGDIRASALFTHYLPNADTGSFTATSASDGITRLFTYRALKDYPLVVGVGVSQAVALAPYYERRNTYVASAIAASLVIAFFGFWVARLLAQQARSNRTLRESEERFQVAAHGGSTGIWDWDLAHSRYYVSPQFKALLGFGNLEQAFDRDEFVQRLHPEDRDRVLEGGKRQLHDRTPYSADYRMRCEDGSYRWFHSRGQAIWNEKGEAIRFSGSISDITERKLADRARAELAAVTQNAQDAIIVRNLEGVITSWNRAAERLFGYAEDEAVGRHIGLIAPPGASRFEVNGEMLRRSDIIPPYETQCVTKSGRVFDALVTVSTIRSETGELIGASGTTRDVTEQKKAVQVLRDSEQRFRSFFERNNAVMTMVHPETGAIENANEAAARFYGYPRETLRTMNIGAINRMSLDELAALRRDAAGGKKNYFVLSHRLADGRVRDVEVYLTPVEYAGRPVLFSIIHDITERRAAEEQLRQLNAGLEARVARRTEEILEASQELESFSYSVSHDLRTPLRAIIGFSNIVVVANRDKLDTDSVRHLDRVQAAAARMAELIDDLLNLAHVSRQELRRQDIDLGVMAGNIVEALSQAHPGREVKVAVQPRLRTHGDPGLVRIALENLISNAWKFTARNPDAAIEIGAGERGGRRAWFVHDNGTGFDMRYVDRLFAPFQRLHGEKEFEGTGIGLSIVKRIIRRHGGQVWVESEEGKGSTFFFTLEPGPAAA